MEFKIGDYIMVFGLNGLFYVSGVIHDDEKVFFMDDVTGDELSTSFDKVTNIYREVFDQLEKGNE